MPANYLSVSEATSESFLNDTHTILFRELLPFSLRHWILLSSLQSPLIYGGEVKLHDIRLAVIACSTKSYPEFLAACKFKLGYWSLWKRLTKLSDVPNALHQFNRYVDDYLPQYPFLTNLGQSSESKLDGFIVTASRLLSSCTPDYIENMPLGKLVTWVMAKNEGEGFPNKNLMSDFDVHTFRTNPAFAGAF